MYICMCIMYMCIYIYVYLSIDLPICISMYLLTDLQLRGNFLLVCVELELHLLLHGLRGRTKPGVQLDGFRGTFG